ncbi:MAG: DNA-3-methyladenine glycosylase I [Proteobacteria bacterium]|nr:DNA-3-methyladenine glycosylase I [Pseudomonadota bacterium]
MPTKKPRKEVVKTRCEWASDPDNAAYHDAEWGVPVHDDRMFFEFLTLEGAQAGLSWLTVLRRREGYRRAFADFDPVQVSRFTAADVRRLLQDPGIIRHRLKVESTISNAAAFLAVQGEFGSFDAFIWSFVGGQQIVTRRRTLKDVPATTPESDAMAKALKKRGFRFVGSTICYAFMQACGLVNDHTDCCFKRPGLQTNKYRR